MLTRSMNEDSHSTRLSHQKHVLEALLHATSLNGSAPGEELLALLLQETQATGFDRVRLYVLSNSDDLLSGRAHVGMDADFFERIWTVTDDPNLEILFDSPHPHLFK